jgi:hypothetical protein
MNLGARAFDEDSPRTRGLAMNVAGLWIAIFALGTAADATAQSGIDPDSHDGPPPGIRAMRLYANPSADATWVGFCPKTLHFSGEIDYRLPPGGRPVSLGYRYVATRGTQVVRSDAFTTLFTTSGKKILHVFNLDFPLSTGNPAFKAPAAHDARDVYEGSVALEFTGNPPIHATLRPAPFAVTCIKKGTVAAPLGGSGNLASPMAPIEPVDPNGSAPIPHGTAQQPLLPNLVIRSVTATPGFGGTIGFRVRVVNIGDATTTATHVKFFRDSSPVPGADVMMAPLRARATHDVLVPPSAALAAPGTLVVRVDPDDTVNESNENDNAATIRR